MEMLKKEEVISVFIEILKNSHYGCAENLIETEFHFKNYNNRVTLIFTDDKFLRKRPFNADSALCIGIFFKEQKIRIYGSGNFEKIRSGLTFNELIIGERIAKLAEILN